MISRLYKAFFCKFVNSAQPIASPLPLYREEPTRKMFDKPVRELVIRSTGDFSHELPQFPYAPSMYSYTIQVYSFFCHLVWLVSRHMFAQYYSFYHLILVNLIPPSLFSVPFASSYNKML